MDKPTQAGANPPAERTSLIIATPSAATRGQLVTGTR